MRYWLLILSVFIFIGCSEPSNDFIRSDFQRAYPTAQIVIINPMEKTSDTYRVSINYREPGSDIIREDVFLYRYMDGQWVNTWRKSGKKQREQTTGMERF